jgi:tetratricopeptide (TPR) repeat protein
MTSRLAVFCEKLLEAGWLAALVVVPLFFNIYSSRVFEPDKLSLLRSIALLMVAAWIVRQIEGLRAAVNNEPLARRARAAFRENPLLLPTLLIVIVYLISTVFSITFFVSIWGSYMRMQGTYTTFSYIVVFLIAANYLRTRAQFDRAVNTILATAFPIAIYGAMQHFQLDPLPWAGDVTARVAANMGNSIFVAAYLIMVVPIALARWLEVMMQWSAQGDGARGARIGYISIAVAVAALSVLGWLLDFGLGAAFVVTLLLGAFAFAWLTRTSVRQSVLLAAVTVVLTAVIATIFFTQSRGPWVGLAGGLFLFVVLYALVRGARRLMLGALGLGALGFVFIVIFNMPTSPLDPLKSVPYIGRLGQIFETESGTGKVRELIWQGAIPLVLPHEPLWSPTTGDDALNVIRPLVGYGPESMYVAYNRFYPSDLAHYEARNATPDRSHNETFDSLVITGLFGFGTYIFLFISIVYYALKWLGTITTGAERNAFIVLWLTSGLVTALAFGLLGRWNFVGVALPAGMILGLYLFLVIVALRRAGAGENRTDRWRVLWLSALLAALIAHFVEINFGIAIAATRTYFWFYCALLVLIGTHRLSDAAPVAAVAPTQAPPPIPRASSRRRRNRRAASARTATPPRASDETAPVLAWTVIVILILITLGFEFFTIQASATSSWDAVLKALFTKAGVPSFGVFVLLALAWLVAAALGLDLWRGSVGFSIALFVVLSVASLMWYALLHLRSLMQGGDQAEALLSLITFYYAALFLVIGALALALGFDEPVSGLTDWLRAPLNAAVAPVLLIIAAALTVLTNYAGVSADILYKTGLANDSVGAWDRSVVLYTRALELQPAQDFYALFLGRAYLESARAVQSAVQRAGLLDTSERTLLNALRTNPMNTDHSANLGRLHRTWATLVDDPAQKTLRLQKSIAYYQDAIRLSPNTVHLRNEMAQTYIQQGDYDNALLQLNESLQRDQKYAQTYYFLGEYYRARDDKANAAENYLKAIALDPAVLSMPDGSPQETQFAILTAPEFQARAVEAYRAAIIQERSPIAAHYALAELHERSGRMDLARRELEEAFKSAPNDYLVGLTLVNFLSEQGQIDDAVSVMRRVVEIAAQARAPDFSRFQDFYNQLQNLQRVIQAAKNSPNDPNARRSLAAIWKARGQPQFALPEYQALVRLASNDYDAQKNVALLSLQLSRLDDAQAALVRAAPIAPENEKGMWQNLQVALNAQKARQSDQAIQAAQAALALAAEADKLALQAYLNQLQAGAK